VCPPEEKALVIEFCDPDHVPDGNEEAGEVGVCTGTGDAAPEPKRRRVEEKSREGSRRVDAN
jgi:hypothetical protein